MHLARRVCVALILIAFGLGTNAAAQELTDDQKSQLKDMRRLGYNKLYAKDFDASKEQFDTMISTFPGRWEGYYDMACWNLRQKQLDPAMEWLYKAVEHGCDDISFFKTDTDLRSIRKQRPAEFAQLLDQVETKARAAKEKLIMKEAEALASSLPKDALFDFDFNLEQHLTEGKLSLGDLKGKVVIVDIWGTWCGPCRREVPHFVELADKYRELGLHVVGINYEKGSSGSWLGYEEAKQKVQRDAKKLKINYTLLHGSDAVLKQVPAFRGFPTTMFIDHLGRVRVKEAGYKPIEHLEPIVLALIADKIKADKGEGEQVEEKAPVKDKPSTRPAKEKPSTRPAKDNG